MEAKRLMGKTTARGLSLFFPFKMGGGGKLYQVYLYVEWEEPEAGVYILSQRVVAELLGLRDLVEDVLNQVAQDQQRVQDYRLGLRTRNV